MRRQSSAVRSSNGIVWKMPALLTTASSRPNDVDRVVDDRLAAFGRVDGVVVGHRAAARRLDLGDDRVGHGRIFAVTRHRAADVVDHHGGSAARQVERVQAAEPTPGAGHDHDLAVKSIIRRRSSSTRHAESVIRLSTSRPRPGKVVRRSRRRRPTEGDAHDGFQLRDLTPEFGTEITGLDAARAALADDDARRATAGAVRHPRRAGLP